MYYQSSSTTTTTTTSARGRVEKTTPLAALPPDGANSRLGDDEDSQRVALYPAHASPAAAPTPERLLVSEDGGAGRRASQPGLAGASGGGPLGDPSPLALSLYEAANDRPATRLERILLSELEAAAAAPAEAAGSSGAEWVAAALREAVGSGSSFVAPKRIREIIGRWAVAGAGPRGIDTSARVDTGAPSHAHAVVKHALEESLEERAKTAVCVSRADAAQGDRLWGVVLDMLAVDDARDDIFRLRGVIPLGEREDGAFLLGAPTRVAARLLAGRHRRAVEQALSSLLPAPATVAVLDPDEWTIEH